MSREVFALLLIPFCLAAAGAETIKMNHTESAGIFEPAMAELLQKAGFTPVLSPAPLARIQGDMKKGDVDGIFPVGEASLAAADGVKVLPMMLENRVIAVTINPEVEIKTAADLKPYQVAILRGQKDHIDLTKGCPWVIETSDYETGAKMLDAGRCDVLLTSNLLVHGLMNRLGVKDYRIQSPPLRAYPLFIGLSPRRADWAERIGKALRAEIDSGRWQTLMEKALSGE